MKQKHLIKKINHESFIYSVVASPVKASMGLFLKYGKVIRMKEKVSG
jgi:hypothetical protein